MKTVDSSEADAPSEPDSFTDAFAIAKQALTYIGTYRTPPTPPIYRLWYHYAEGKDARLTTELSAIVERETIDAARLQAITREYSDENFDVGLQHRATATLASEIAALQGLLDEQNDAGKDFRQAIQSSSESLRNRSVGAAELQACVNDLLASNAKMNTKLVETELKLAASQQHIDSLRRELLDSQKAMLTDNLTGIGNRRFFELLMQQALERVPTDATPGATYVLTLVDLDGFKNINDTLGHTAGDETLRFAAHEMQRLAGDGSVARLGGDEFGVLQRVSKEEPVDALGQAVRDFFSNKKLVLQQTGSEFGKLTASVGVAVLRDDDDRSSWFERADRFLYAAKKAGKNRVMCERSLR